MDTGRRRAGVDSDEPNAATRLGAARPTVVAGVAGTDGGERFELAGGEVLRASNDNGGTTRVRAIQRAGRGLRACASKMGASK